MPVLRRRPREKPRDFNFEIDHRNPDWPVHNLGSAIILNERGGVPFDLVTKQILAPNASTSGFGTYRDLNGVLLNADDEGFRYTTPASLKPTTLVTLFLRLRHLAAPTGTNPGFGGCTWDTANTSPYGCYNITYVTSGSSVGASWNLNGATNQFMGSSQDYDLTQICNYCFVLTGSNAHLYKNAVRIDANPPQAGDIGYDAANIIGIGEPYAAGRNPNILVDCMYIWPNVALNAEQVRLVTENPFGAFRRRIRVAYFLPLTSATFAGDTLPTLEDSAPSAYLLDASGATAVEETFPTLEEGTPTAALTLSSGVEAPEETLPTLADGVPTAILAAIRGTKPLILLSSFLDTGNRFSSDIKVNHPTRTYHPEVGVWGGTERGISIPPGGPIINGGEVTVMDAPDPITGVQYWRENLDTTTQQRRRVIEKLGFEGGSESVFPVIYSGEFEDAKFKLDRTTIKYKDFWSQALDAVIPNVINRNNYPNLPAGSDSAYPTQVYGSCISPAGNQTGVVPLKSCGFESILGDLYFVSLLPCKQVVTVYRQLPDEEAPTAVPADEWHWFVEPMVFYAEMPDIWFQPTMMHFFDQQPEGTKAWADVLGLDRRPQLGPLPAISGEVLDNPIDIITANLSLMLRVEPIDIPINYDAWTTAREFFETNNLKFAMVVNESVNFRTKFSWIQADSHAHIFQNRFGEMAAKVAVDSNPNRHIFTEAHDIMRYVGRSYREKSELDIEIRQPTRAEIFNTFNVEYALNFSNNQFAGSYPYVNQPDKDEYGKTKDMPLQQRCIRELATSQWSAQQTARYYAIRSYRARYSVKALTLTHNNVERLELADLHGVTYYGAPGGAWINKEVLPYYLNFIAPELRYEVESIVLALVEPPVSDGVVLPAGIWAENSRVGPFVEETRRYIFGMFKKDSTNTELMVLRTANYRDFTEQDDAGFTALSNIIGSFDTHRVGNVLHVATQELVTGRVAYHAFSLSSSRWTTFNEEVLASNSDGDYAVSIGVDSSGNPFIWYQADQVFRSGSVAPASAPDGYYKRTALKRRISSGSWTPALEIGSPDLAFGSFFFIINYLGKVHDVVGRAIAGRENRIRFIWGRSEPSDVANTPDLWTQTLNANGSLGPSTEFQFTGGLGYTAIHAVGDYATFDYLGDLWIAAPIAFDVLSPHIYFFKDQNNGTTPEKIIALSNSPGLTHNGVASMPSISVRWLNGQLHALFASGWGAGDTWSVYKTVDPPFDSTDVDPTWDGSTARDLQAGPVWGANGLQMAAGDFATVSGKLWMFAFYSLGGSQLFESIKVEDLPIDPGYTGAEWLADHA